MTYILKGAWTCLLGGFFLLAGLGVIGFVGSVVTDDGRNWHGLWQWPIAIALLYALGRYGP